jgi:hypothetical protein
LKRTISKNQGATETLARKIVHELSTRVREHTPDKRPDLPKISNRCFDQFRQTPRLHSDHREHSRAPRTSGRSRP